ncbi:MAG: hypothetical protein M0019_04885 [Actinomycetota bacterium]|nr:hypothetical protein [Actinomycetota bacterium]
MKQRITALIDTTSSYSILAILCDDEVIDIKVVEEPKTLLKEIGYFSIRLRSTMETFEEFEFEVVLCIGPSGFSGGRIGVATGRSLALGWGVDVIVFDHLEMLSHITSEAYPHEVLFEDARGGEVHIFKSMKGSTASSTVDFEEGYQIIGSARSVLLVGGYPRGMVFGEDRQISQIGVSELPIVPNIGPFIESIRDRERVSPDRLQVKYGRDYVAVANFEKLR